MNLWASRECFPAKLSDSLALPEALQYMSTSFGKVYREESPLVYWTSSPYDIFRKLDLIELTAKS